MTAPQTVADVRSEASVSVATVKALLVEVQSSQLVWEAIAGRGGTVFNGARVTSSEAMIASGALEYVIKRLVKIVAEATA